MLPCCTWAQCRACVAALPSWGCRYSAFSSSRIPLITAFTLMVSLLCVCMIIGHLLEETPWMNESITALILGLCAGFAVLVCTKGTNSHILQFDEELFFIYLLPPIIFNAGHSTDREIAIMILMAYLSYILAELLYLSGILTVFFCGILMSHYTWHNVTESSRITTSVMTSVGLCATLIGLVLVGRAAFVLLLSLASNLARRGIGTEISFRQQVIIWWAGLMRRAVSIALAYKKFTANSAINATMITSTILVVLFSTVVFGLMTKPLLRWLLPPHLGDMLEPETPNLPRVSSGGMHVPLLEEGELMHQHSAMDRGSTAHIFRRSSSTVHHLWRKFDDSSLYLEVEGLLYPSPGLRTHRCKTLHHPITSMASGASCKFVISLSIFQIVEQMYEEECNHL